LSYDVSSKTRAHLGHRLLQSSPIHVKTPTHPVLPQLHQCPATATDETAIAIVIAIEHLLSTHRDYLPITAVPHEIAQAHIQIDHDHHLVKETVIAAALQMTHEVQDKAAMAPQSTMIDMMTEMDSAIEFAKETEKEIATRTGTIKWEEAAAVDEDRLRWHYRRQAHRRTEMIEVQAAIGLVPHRRPCRRILREMLYGPCSGRLTRIVSAVYCLSRWKESL
jgi:hypothetical protein